MIMNSPLVVALLSEVVVQVRPVVVAVVVVVGCGGCVVVVDRSDVVVVG